jgi:succinoglycan biosynthesis transport protein ExoP
VLKRWWWLLAIGAGVAAFMGFLVAARLPATYEAESRLLVGPLNADRDQQRAAGQNARTFATIATTRPIILEAARRVGLPPETVESKVHDVTASDVTRFITIRVRDSDRARAANIANAIADELLERGASETGLSPTGKLTIVERAVAPENTIGPSPALIVSVAALAGLLGAFGFAVLVDSMSVVVRNEDDLAGIGPVAFLGSVNGLRAGRPLPLILEADPESSAAIPYRVLAAKIALSNGKQPLRSLLVLDAHGGRSSARLAASLAGALAEGGSHVALIDTDEGGEIAAVFGLYRERKGDDKNRLFQKARPLRVGRVSLDRFRFRRPGLTIVHPRTRVEPLELEWAGELLERLLEEADLVVVAAPAVDRSPSALVWSRLADATVLVVERDHTKREEIPAAVDSLRIAGGNVIGTVLCRDRLF